MSTSVISRAERRAAGVAARQQSPPAAIAGWTVASDRPDPVDLILGQATTRIPDLVPVRHGRMSASPFAFYRGGALIMAADVARLPLSGITVQVCGDAHLVNFGLFASPERDLLFDVNDFDETLTGAWEWDVMRLSASLVLAARSRSFSHHQARHAVLDAVRTYRERMTEYAAMRAIDVYYARVDGSEIVEFANKRARPYLESTIQAAAHHDALHELPKITTLSEGKRRISDHPPVITHPEGMRPELLAAGLASYRESLQEDRRVLLDRYQMVDAALKVVGVGSVGLGAYVMLLEGGSDTDPLFLQAKVAEASVFERFTHPSGFATHGERVVAGQRLLQAASDVLLGWGLGPNAQLYIRQLQDQKGSAVVEVMEHDDLRVWGRLCGWALARGHARSGDPSMLAGYLGRRRHRRPCDGRLRRGVCRPGRPGPCGVPGRYQGWPGPGRDRHLTVGRTLPLAAPRRAGRDAASRRRHTHPLLDIDEGLLADGDEPVLRPVQVDDEGQDHAEGDDHHHGTQDAPSALEAGAVADHAKG